MQSPWHSEQSVLKEGHVLGGGQVPAPMFANLLPNAVQGAGGCRVCSQLGPKEVIPRNLMWNKFGFTEFDVKKNTENDVEFGDD